MKKSLVFSLVLAFGLLTACGPAEPAPTAAPTQAPAPVETAAPAPTAPAETPAPSAQPLPTEMPAPAGPTAEDQLTLLSDQRQVWMAPESFGWMGYTVTDLDQNGRLELVASSIQGTGLFVHTQVWEVSPDGSALLPVESDPDEPFALEPGNGSPLPVYREDDGDLHYIIDLFTRIDMTTHGEARTALSLEDGEAEGECIASCTTVYDENGNAAVTFADEDDRPFTEDDYNAAADREFEGDQKGEASFVWFDHQALDEDPDAALDLLTDAWEGFSLRFG